MRWFAMLMFCYRVLIIKRLSDFEIGPVLETGDVMDWKLAAKDPIHWKAAAELLEFYGVDTSLEGDELLVETARVFSRLPYENLSKLIRKHTRQPGPDRFRLPGDVFTEHVEKGAGGTCFSLSCLFGSALDVLGISSYPVLSRMRTGSAMHCGLVAVVGEEKFLLDPGYLVNVPVRLNSEGVSACDMETGRVELVPSKEGFVLHAGGKQRYVFKDEPMSISSFMALWAESFDWVMMNNIHLTRLVAGGYMYVHGHRVRRNAGGEKSNENIRARHVEALREYFGISPDLSEEALELVRKIRRNSGKKA